MTSGGQGPADSPADATPADVVFLDTNVLVYAHDASEPRKRDVARALLLDHLGAGTLRTSTQALSEYFSVVTGKGEVPLDAAAASWLIEQLPADAVVTPGLTTLRAAVRLSAAAGISIWDALIAEAARECGARVLYTEDVRLLRAVNAAAELSSAGGQAVGVAGEPVPSAAGSRRPSGPTLTAVDPFVGTSEMGTAIRRGSSM